VSGNSPTLVVSALDQRPQTRHGVVQGSLFVALFLAGVSTCVPHDKQFMLAAAR
jgi:hypothetical protein